MRIAIMQPYFIPYAGYFRLFAAVDLFVILDDVQHIKRGYVHRNKLLNRTENPEWLTLPIKSSPRDTVIRNLGWEKEAEKVWKKRLKKFSMFDNDNFPLSLVESPCDFIIKSMEGICATLDLRADTVRSSELDIPPGLKAQDKILAICNHFKAIEYVNAPGGRKLYNEDAFRLHGIKLEFLPEWKGSYLSILQHIEEPSLREEVVSQC